MRTENNYRQPRWGERERPGVSLTRRLAAEYERRRRLHSRPPQKSSLLIRVHLVKRMEGRVQRVRYDDLKGISHLDPPAWLKWAILLELGKKITFIHCAPGVGHRHNLFLI